MTLGKQRIMPTHHVEYLLEIYSEYLKKRMLDSGRLSKGKNMRISKYFTMKVAPESNR